jgi:hypothetical protein
MGTYIFYMVKTYNEHLFFEGLVEGLGLKDWG